MGYKNPYYEPAYQLCNGIFLFGSERDVHGHYIGFVGMDGIYLRVPSLYQPLYDDAKVICAFEKIKNFTA